MPVTENQRRELEVKDLRVCVHDKHTEDAIIILLEEKNLPIEKKELTYQGFTLSAFVVNVDTLVYLSNNRHVKKYHFTPFCRKIYKKNPDWLDPWRIWKQGVTMSPEKMMRKFVHNLGMYPSVVIGEGR